MEMHDPHDKRSLGFGWQDTVFGGLKSIDQGTINGYYKSVEEVEKIVGYIIKILKERKVYDNTAIIMTSDHGQALMEDGYFGHGNYLFDTIIRVPLWIKMPSSKKFCVNEGYQSLTAIYNFLLNLSESTINSDIITSEIAFSESSGFFDPFVKKYRNKTNFETIMGEKNGVRKAIYKGEFKLTYNFTKGSIDEFKKRNKNVDPVNFKSDVQTLIDELSIFSNTDLKI
jgi:arylsulfatase A-like enzyme